MPSQAAQLKDSGLPEHTMPSVSSLGVYGSLCLESPSSKSLLGNSYLLFTAELCPLPSGTPALSSHVVASPGLHRPVDGEGHSVSASPQAEASPGTGQAGASWHPWQCPPWSLTHSGYTAHECRLSPVARVQPVPLLPLSHRRPRSDGSFSDKSQACVPL